MSTSETQVMAVWLFSGDSLVYAPPGKADRFSGWTWRRGGDGEVTVTTASGHVCGFEQHESRTTGSGGSRVAIGCVTLDAEVAFLDRVCERPGTGASWFVRDGHSEAAMSAAISAGYVTESSGGSGGLSITAAGFKRLTGRDMCTECRFVDNGRRTHHEWSRSVYGFNCSQVQG